MTFSFMSYAADSKTVAQWDFGAEETSEIKAHKGVKRDQAGPVSPEFPDFSTTNTAVHLDGQGARFTLEDPGPQSPYDFSNGDSITLEAWVFVERLRDGQNMYVIGKGRTNSPHFPRDNQNWAMRIVGAKGSARLSFLFATPNPSGRDHWHRWTSKKGFDIITGWHHIAVQYTFGAPKSIKGWVDGNETEGVWDMGGETKEAPVVDDDAIWIGSSLGGNPSSSFHGLLDSVAIHRAYLDADTMKKRFNRVGGPRVIGPLPEVMPEINDVPEGRVLVTLHERFSSYERWLYEGETWPQETMRWVGDSFLLPRIPVRYDEWGIRSAWKGPVLMRIATDVDLPPGEHTFMVRARALGRLWVNGEVVARTEPRTKSPPSGEEPMTPWATPLIEGMRTNGYRMQEVLGTASLSAQDTPTRVVFEVILGGKDARVESGEVNVSVLNSERTMYSILVPKENAIHSMPIALTDASVLPALKKVNASLADFDDQTRRLASTSRDEFWKMRHTYAREWVSLQPTHKTFDNPDIHPVDAFIAAKIERSRAIASQPVDTQSAQFREEVLPILQDACFRCHGEKEKGGLRLNSRDHALSAGDSEIPAIVPGEPDSSELVHRIRSQDEDLRMPPKGDGLDKDAISTIEAWIKNGAPWSTVPETNVNMELAPLLADTPFIRRLFLDTIGIPPNTNELHAFLNDPNPAKRSDWIKRLVDDPRGVDRWMSFWQDMLAENPTLLNASLNSTGPFRWFIHDALRDDKPIDRIVSELIMMRGSPHHGGSAGFALAGENDAPYAAKGHILASAFLGIEMQCARCHDAPYHSSTQRDLFSLSAMLQRKSVTVPKTSTVPAAFFEEQDRTPLIRVTLKPGEEVKAQWPFSALVPTQHISTLEALMEKPNDTREQLATFITAPQNMRFAQVLVNRIWKELMGAGIVEPVYDWEGQTPSHPELLNWLALEFISNDYNPKHVISLILQSKAYQREAHGRNHSAVSEQRYFNAPDVRRLSAEQIVDSLFSTTGVAMDVEELTFVHDGRRAMSNRLTLGHPTRAWMFASLSNERDRPSLNLPRARAVTDVLQAFGWTGSRQKPITHRETEPNVLQPGILANGTLSLNLSRAAEGSALAQLAIDAYSPETLANELYARFLGRTPLADEHVALTNLLATGFESRLVEPVPLSVQDTLTDLPLVTWFNHLQSEANTIQQKISDQVRKGPAPDRRLDAKWRARYEDAVWSLINHREFIWNS